MQTFCLELCKANGVKETRAIEVALRAPDWTRFFEELAAGTAKVAFDRLRRGPSARSDRIDRHLNDGTVTDIYGAVLAGIAFTGPLVELTYEQLRQALRDLMDDPPQKHEVTGVLEQMARIAREIEGEPVVDYDKDLSTLHITDPFFAYYLRWGGKGLTPRSPQ